MALDQDRNAPMDQGARATSATSAVMSEADRYLSPPWPRPASSDPASSARPSTGTSSRTAGASEAASATAAPRTSTRGQARSHPRIG